MDDLKKILEDERYKGRIESLKSDDLKTIIKDETKALELARKGIAEIEPEKKEDLEYLYSVTHKMQRFARLILKRRNLRN